MRGAVLLLVARPLRTSLTSRPGAVEHAPGASRLTMRRGANADSGHRRGGDAGRQARGAAGARRPFGVRAHLEADARRSRRRGAAGGSGLRCREHGGRPGRAGRGRLDRGGTPRRHLSPGSGGLRRGGGRSREGLPREPRCHADAPRRHPCLRSGVPAARGLQLVDRGIRATAAGGHRRRSRRHACDELRLAEGDDRVAAVRPHSPWLRRWHRHPAADDLRAAGPAEPGGVGFLLEHHPRAPERSGRGAAGVRRCASLVRVAALGDRLPRPRRHDRRRQARRWSP